MKMKLKGWFVVELISSLQTAASSTSQINMKEEFYDCDSWA